jgi:hypothetical protein
MQTATRANSGNIAEIDIDGEFGTVTLPAVVGKPATGKRGQVIPEGSSNRPLVSRIIDAQDEERKAAMRAFFRTACAEGLDCKASERMRREISHFLGRWIYSRKDVRTGEWIELQTAAWCGLLAW